MLFLCSPTHPSPATKGFYSQATAAANRRLSRNRCSFKIKIVDNQVTKKKKKNRTKVNKDAEVLLTHRSYGQRPDENVCRYMQSTYMQVLRGHYLVQYSRQQREPYNLHPQTLKRREPCDSQKKIGNEANGSGGVHRVLVWWGMQSKGPNLS